MILKARATGESKIPLTTPKELKQKASGKKKENRKFLQSLKKQKPGLTDRAFHTAHEEVFACTECLKCANCCKTTGPLFTARDIQRIAKHLKMRPADFTEHYLRLDEDDDYVLKSVPCPFLGADNYCGIYEVRPKACSDYPHTDRRNMHEIFNLTLKNTEVCPAVFDILEKMKVTAR